MTGGGEGGPKPVMSRRNPLVAPEPDPLGLSPEQRAEFDLYAAYRRALGRLGLVATERILAELRKRPLGRPKGTKDPGRDALLLQLYDATELRRGAAARIGEYCHETHQGVFGATAKAVSTRVLRLVHQRAQGIAARRVGNALDPDQPK